MTTAEMLTEIREVLADELPTYGWSDVRLLAYLNEGQDKFCEQTGYFADRSLISIPTVAGTAVYALDTRIIRTNEVFIGTRRLTKGLGIQPDAEAPEPTLWQADTDSGMLTVWPTPTDVVTMKLHVWRYATAELSLGHDPEIPRTCQRACVEWAAWKAYGHHDAELQDGKEAKQHLAEFARYVADGRVLRHNMTSSDIVVAGDPCYVV